MQGTQGKCSYAVACCAALAYIIMHDTHITHSRECATALPARLHLFDRQLGPHATLKREKTEVSLIYFVNLVFITKDYMYNEKYIHIYEGAHLIRGENCFIRGEVLLNVVEEVAIVRRILTKCHSRLLSASLTHFRSLSLSRSLT